MCPSGHMKKIKMNHFEDLNKLIIIIIYSYGDIVSSFDSTKEQKKSIVRVVELKDQQLF